MKDEISNHPNDNHDVATTTRIITPHIIGTITPDSTTTTTTTTTILPLEETTMPIVSSSPVDPTSPTMMMRTDPHHPLVVLSSVPEEQQCPIRPLPSIEETPFENRKNHPMHPPLDLTPTTSTTTDRSRSKMKVQASSSSCDPPHRTMSSDGTSVKDDATNAIVLESTSTSMALSSVEDKNKTDHADMRKKDGGTRKKYTYYDPNRYNDKN
jgi:hypothetical protein